METKGKEFELVFDKAWAELAFEANENASFIWRSSDGQEFICFKVDGKLAWVSREEYEAEKNKFNGSYNEKTEDKG